MKIKLLSVLALFAVNAMANPTTMHYNNSVELTGQLKFETIKPRDADGKPLKAITGIPMFHTKNEILTTYKSDVEFQDFPEFTTDTFQLAFLDAEMPKKAGCYTVTAEPYGKHSPYHYTNVLLAVNKIKSCK